ncbi:MAG: hypothetical protein DWH70_01770 [Planctomycetota bacterium]|nr:MAG: hypothetical protein DWH70_01770 [Planctomycetota bacterium]
MTAYGILLLPSVLLLASPMVCGCRIGA